MKAPRTVRPLIEALEDRVVPTTNLTFDGSGNLTAVSSNDATLLLQLTADNTVDVIANAVDQGTFATTTSLTVTELNSAGNPNITFDPNGFEFDGNLIINAGNAVGGNVINIGGAGPAGGTIAGNVTVTSGNGPDSFFYGQNADITQFGSLRVDLGTTNPIIGPDTIQLGANGGSSLTGNVTLFNGTNVGVSNLPIGGSLTINSAKQLAAIGVSVIGTTIGGSLSVTTAGLNDFVLVDASTTVQYAGVFNLGNGANGGDFLDESGTILGSVSVQAGNGPETIFVEGTVGGSLAVTVGTGADHLTLSSLTVLGNAIRVKTGNGANTLNVNTLNAPGARLTALFGAGNDTVNLDDTTIVLASAYLDGGFGTNHIHHTGFVFYPYTQRNFS